MTTLLPKYRLSEFKSLDKASFIELFFDLVFVFCMRSLIPSVIGEEGESVGWYTYYTFAFVYVLMLQVWFNSTMLMNRFGTGKPLDIACLVVNMFLLLLMTHAMSVEWDNYLLFNFCWILVNVNLIVHWLLRLRCIQDPTLQIRHLVRRVVRVLALQAFLVLFASAFASLPGQVMCLIALLMGPFAWYTHGQESLGEAHCEHLVDRCALLVIIAFGELIVGVGSTVGEGYTLVDSALFLLLALGMFLVYLNLVKNVIDTRKLGTGLRYMSASAWMVFLVANVTVGFEMMNEGSLIEGIPGEFVFSFCVSLFLLSFFLFMPFAKSRGPIRKRWVAKRAAACLVAFAVALLVSASAASFMLHYVGPLSASPNMIATAFFYFAAVLGLISVYLVLLIDWHAYGKLEEKD